MNLKLPWPWGVCVFEVFNHGGGGVEGFPVDAVFAGDEDAAFEDFGIGDDLGEQPGVGRVVGIFHQGRANGGVEIFFDGERVVGAEESECVSGGHAFRVFGERLRGDADAFDFVAGFFEGGFGGAKEF